LLKVTKSWLTLPKFAKDCQKLAKITKIYQKLPKLQNWQKMTCASKSIFDQKELKNI